MSTIGNPKIVVELLEYSGDMNLGSGPSMFCDTIIEYRTGFGSVGWKMIYGRYGGEVGVQTFLATGNIDHSTEPKFLMRSGEITEYGRAFMAEHGERK